MTTTRAALPDVRADQRRVLGTLIGAQVAGGIGLASIAAVGSLLAVEVSGDEAFAGLASTFLVLGAAFTAIPMARIMAARGRRPGLLLGYGLGIVGAVLMVTAGITSNFPLLLVGAALFGGSTASLNQARYAAADLSQPAHRGRDLSIVVWSTTIGSVLGPNLTGPAGAVADALGMPRLTGPFVFSLIGFVVAIVVIAVFLRPDPLLEARRLAAVDSPTDPADKPHGSVIRGFKVVFSRPVAALGLLTIALGHTTMVTVMVMTPIHMQHGRAGLELIGLVISIHIAGMFAFSPLTGMATDRFGGRAVALLGSGVLVAATLLASQSAPGGSASLMVALFLLGLGWSCTLVSGSTLLTSAVPLADRAGAQGASDLAMGLAAGGGGAVAGLIVDQAGYGVLAFCALGLASIIGVAALTFRGRTEGLSPQPSR